MEKASIENRSQKIQNDVQFLLSRLFLISAYVVRFRFRIRVFKLDTNIHLFPILWTFRLLWILHILSSSVWKYIHANMFGGPIRMAFYAIVNILPNLVFLLVCIIVAQTQKSGWCYWKSNVTNQHMLPSRFEYRSSYHKIYDPFLLFVHNSAMPMRHNHHLGVSLHIIFHVTAVCHFCYVITSIQK